MQERSYIAIDLKSFYASVECVERGLNPLTTNLVVADASRTEKTICLAVSPSLKTYGIGGRARLFEVVQRVREVNTERALLAPRGRLTGKSSSDPELKAQPELALDYIAAPPRMALYLAYSKRIFDIYLKYVAPEDIHAYSVDEVFIDATPYLKTYRMTARELTIRMIHDVLDKTGITATAGIGTNLYLCKIAMDIVAKHIPADKDGVRIAELDEMSYRHLLWGHKPLTDFWRVGKGLARTLKANGMDTMGKIARCSVRNEELLYHLFGINAELLIDHAWGWEPCTMELIKAYRPETNSFSSGQVLSCPYDFRKARVVVKEMVDNMVLKLVDRKLVTDQLTLVVNYDVECLKNPEIRQKYHGEITMNHYGQPVPKYANGNVTLDEHTSSFQTIFDAVMKLYDRIVNPDLLVRRLTLSTLHVIDEQQAKEKHACAVQLDLFTDYKALEMEQKQKENILKKERDLQEARLSIKKKFGKNAILKGMNFEDGATAKERNQQIGGHHE